MDESEGLRRILKQATTTPERGKRMGSSELKLSLLDVAHVAKVQRPVVSAWRARSKHTDTPFPAPCGTKNRQELFVAEEIVAWLQRTGKGNNPDAAQDIALYAVDAREHFQVLSALLVLRAFIGRDLHGMDPEDIVDHADELDPDDEFLFAEIEQNTHVLAPLLTLADGLSDAAYSPKAALEKLLEGHPRFQRAEPHFAPAATQLLAATALALAGEKKVFHDATLDQGETLLTLAETTGESSAMTVALPHNSNTVSRLALRRLHLHTFLHEDFALEPLNAQTQGLVTLAHYPTRLHPDLTAEQILTDLDEITMNMDATQAAVVLAPAALLTDALPPAAAAHLRDAILRSGKIRAAVRLPAGLLLSKPRQPMGLWVMGHERTDLPVAERWIMTADLSNGSLDTAAQHDLTMDLLASMQDLPAIRARAFRFGRIVHTSVLLAGDGNLCKPRQTRRPHSAVPTDTAALQVQAETLLDTLNTQSQPQPLNLTIEPLHATAASATTVDELLRHHHLKLLPGTRLHPHDTTAADGLTILGLPELHGTGTTPRRVQHLRVADAYPRAVLTEPGDIIFTHVGKPAALVDPEGAKIVEYPARILRIPQTNPAGLINTVLAADITTQPRGPWRRWQVRRFPPELCLNTKLVLDSIADQRQSALDRIAQLDRLENLLIEGTTTATLRITPHPPTLEGSN